MNTDYYLYRLSPDGEGEIYGKFPSLQMAQMSANLLLIKYMCFILSGDISKIYFCNEDGTWDYDLITQSGKEDFLNTYPDPSTYIMDH